MKKNEQNRNGTLALANSSFNELKEGVQNALKLIFFDSDCILIQTIDFHKRKKSKRQVSSTGLSDVR